MFAILRKIMAATGRAEVMEYLSICIWALECFREAWLSLKSGS